MEIRHCLYLSEVVLILCDPLPRYSYNVKMLMIQPNILFWKKTPKVDITGRIRLQGLTERNIATLLLGKWLF